MIHNADDVPVDVVVYGNPARIILTDEVTGAWSGMNTRQYKRLKGLKKQNLWDNMSTLELLIVSSKENH